MKSFQDRANAMTALSVTVIVLKVLVKKGIITRDDVVRSLLDEAVAKALAAEDADVPGDDTAAANRQASEMLKFIADQI